MLPDTTEGTAPAPTRPSTYYVAPLLPEENTGIQSCAYFDEQWDRVWPPTPLDSKGAMSVRIEQADAGDILKLPLELQKAIDGNAVLIGAAVRTDLSSLPTLFTPLASDGSITVNVAAKATCAAILLFSARDIAHGTFCLRPTPDPQITNSSM